MPSSQMSMKQKEHRVGSIIISQMDNAKKQEPSKYISIKLRYNVS